MSGIMDQDNQQLVGSDPNDMQIDEPASPAPPKPRRRKRVHRPGQVVDEAGENVRGAFLSFLNEYVADPDEAVTDFDSTKSQPEAYYIAKLRSVYEVDELVTLLVDFNHLAVNQDLMDFIECEYMHIRPYLKMAVEDFAREHKERLETQDDGDNREASEKKKFSVGFYNMPMHHKLRDLKCDKIGQLTSISGTVTRTSEVRPELISGSFICLDCGTVIKKVEQQFKYTLPTRCTNKECGNTTRFQLDVKASECCDWQRLRVQESSEDIPAGSMPRSVDVILRDDCVEKCKPGDKIMFTGSLVPIPDVSQLSGKSTKLVKRQMGSGKSGSAGLTGLKALGVRSLTCKLVFLACAATSVHSALGQANIRDDADDDEDFGGLTEEERNQILEMKDSSTIYQDLAKSIAPNVFGHDDIKRGILLMLFGGVAKKATDGTKLRGDLNICIVGDPSTAKSQFLKFVTKLLPRTVYTSGKASTSAGLTASVTRDPETGEFGIEAGALMLADNGVCCIDEFDKMDPKDQAAIHEAMEQQTITITKAGIQATLNARASILAAANPRMGRYDTSRSLRANVDISPPIMSRFDLFFVVVDECDETIDTFIAEHIVGLHRNKKDAIRGPYTISDIQQYIRFARSIKPKLTKDAQELLVNFYVQYRMQDDNERKAYRFTVRQLESMIRLAEALARVHLNEHITKAYVREAARLLKQSIINVDQGEVKFEDEEDEVPDVMDTEPREDEEEEEKFSIKYQEYIDTAKAIVYRIRSEGWKNSMQQSDIENEVLKDLYEQDKLSDTRELRGAQAKLTFVIRRLIEVDKILLISKSDPSGEDKDRWLEVHPNYDIDARHEIQERKRKEQAKQPPAKKKKADASAMEEDEEADLEDKTPPEDAEEADEEPQASADVDEILKEVEETLPDTLPQDSLPDTIPQIDETEL